MRKVVGLALLAGMLGTGCGVAPVAVPVGGAIRPVTAAHVPVDGLGLSVHKTVMPPLEVFKSFEADTKAFLTTFKKERDLQWAVTSPVIDTLRLNVGKAKVGYLVTANGTLKWNPTTNNGGTGCFLATFAYDPSGKPLGYSHVFVARGETGKVERLPGRLAPAGAGPLTLRPLPQKPPALAGMFAELLAEQSAKIAARVTPYKALPLSQNPDIVEIGFEGKVVGYLDHQVTMAIAEAPNGKAFLGIEALNVVDAEGTDLASRAYVTNTAHPLNYKVLDL